MATANITRDEAAARSEVIRTEAYRVTVDLTGREATDPERTGVLGTGFFRNLGGPGLAPSPDAVLAAIDQGLRA